MLGFKKSFSTFSVSDLKVAEGFYSKTLGLKTSRNDMGLLELQLPGNTVLIYPKNDHVAAAFTVLNFIVPDIESAVKDLKEKKIEFENYDGSIETDGHGIHRGDQGPAIAWFRDPSGNILSVIEEK